MGFIVKCGKCGKSFSNMQARATHIKWIHETPSRRKCVVCLKSFRDSFDLNRHVKSVHVKGKARDSFKSCPICDCRINKKSAPEHFQAHEITLETDSLKFADSATFEQWKTNMELETNSRFVKQRAPRTVQQGVIVNEYCCHRSGNFKSKSRGIRTLKVRGTHKICAYCPAAIWTKSLTSGEVFVTFQKTHVGHKNEVSRRSLTKENAECTSKIAIGVPFSECFQPELTPCAEETARLECPQFTPSPEETPSQRLSSPTQSVEADIPDFEERKATLVAKFSDMVKCIKSNAGLEALERRMAPLQFIIKSAEKEASVNFPGVPGTVQEPPNKKVMAQKKLYSSRKASAPKKSKLGNLSLSECNAIVVSMLTGDVEECTISTVGFDTNFFH